MNIKKISASRILLAFLILMTPLLLLKIQAIEIDVINNGGEKLELEYEDLWTEPQIVMEVEEFQDYYNSETNNLERGELIRVRKVAEFNGGANWISIMSINGQTVFCLDPNVTAGIGMEYNPSNDFILLPWETQQRIWLVTRFGYQQYGSDDYYIASQILIWRALGYWITPNVNVDNQINQIEANINSFGTPPSFNNQTLELEYKYPKTITDTNGVLSKYNVGCPSGIRCSKNGNDLTITIENLNYDKNGKIDISSPGTNDPSWIGVVWVLPGSQSVASVVQADPSVSFDLKVRMATGNLEIIKVDEYGESTIAGNEFEVAFDSEFKKVIGKYKTNSVGKIEIKDLLPPGTYYAREVSVVNPYLLNNGIFEFEITKDVTTELEVMNHLREVYLDLLKIDEKI